MCPPPLSPLSAERESATPPRAPREDCRETPQQQETHPRGGAHDVQGRAVGARGGGPSWQRPPPRGCTTSWRGDVGCGAGRRRGGVGGDSPRAGDEEAHPARDAGRRSGACLGRGPTLRSAQRCATSWRCTTRSMAAVTAVMAAGRRRRGQGRIRAGVPFRHQGAAARSGSFFAAGFRKRACDLAPSGTPIDTVAGRQRVHRGRAPLGPSALLGDCPRPSIATAATTKRQRKPFFDSFSVPCATFMRKPASSIET